MDQYIPMRVFVVWRSFFALRYIGMFFVFRKIAKFPSWYGIIPLRNEYNLCKYSSKPTWWVVRFILPDLLLFFLKIEINDIMMQFSRGTLLLIGFLSAGFLFLPFLFFQLIVHIDVAKEFGKDSGYALLMTVFPWFFYGYLAYTGIEKVDKKAKT